MEKFYKDKLGIGLLHKTDVHTSYYGTENGVPIMLTEDSDFLDSCLIEYEEIPDNVFYEKLESFMKYVSFYTEMELTMKAKLLELKESFE